MRQATRAFVACALLLAAFCGAVGSADAQTQDTGTAPVPEGASLLNPAISAIGWFQAEAGVRTTRKGAPRSSSARPRSEFRRTWTRTAGRTSSSP